MRNAKKIVYLLVIAFLAAIGAAGCYVPPAGTPGGPVPGRLWLCIYTDDPEAVTLVINAVDNAGTPVTDDTTGAPYVDYTVVATTVFHELPNECESQRPYYQVNFKAAPGTRLIASTWVTGQSRSTLLTCIYYVNGVVLPKSRNDKRNQVPCRTTATV